MNRAIRNEKLNRRRIHSIEKLRNRQRNNIDHQTLPLIIENTVQTTREKLFVKKKHFKLEDALLKSFENIIIGELI